MYLTAREVAAVLRRSLKAFYKLMSADPAFPKVRLPGGGVLISRVGLEQWLRDRTQGMHSPVPITVLPNTSRDRQRTDPAGALK